MATKISINIDLTRSKRVKSHDDSLTHQTFSNQSKSIVYKYRYDRIVVLLVSIFAVLAVSLYLILSKDKNIAYEHPKNKPVYDIIIKEKHLSVPTPIPQKPHKHLVYLYHEEINVLETFRFPLKKQASKIQTTNFQDVKQTITIEKQNKKIKADASMQKIEASSEETKVISTIHTTLKAKPKSKPELSSRPEPESNSAAKLTSKSNSKPKSLKTMNKQFIQINSNDLSRVKLVSNIYKKEPVNELSYIVTGNKDSAKKTYLFTQIDNNAGKSIEHQWWYKGKMVHKRNFPILGKRWRCYSSKNIGKLQQGEWLIKVLDKKGKVLSTVNFLYQVK